jgi:hypothetical protein
MRLDMAKRKKVSPAKRAKNKIASKKIKKYHDEGYPHNQAIAMGLKYAGLSKKTKKSKSKSSTKKKSK